MPINSKNKGNGFERKIANLLATNFPPLQFTRSQSSGAILGGKNISKLIHYSKEAAVLFTGDVVPTNEGSNTGLLFNFCIECKFYKNEDSLYSMLSGKSKIHNWFKEVQIDARKIGKEPLLIFKFNRTPEFVAIGSHIELHKSINKITFPEFNLVLLEDILPYKEIFVTQVRNY